MISIRIKTNASQLLKFCSNVQTSVDDGLHFPSVGDGFEAADNVYIREQQNRFNAEGNGSWKELAPYTKQERARLGYPAAHPILKRKNILYAAFEQGNPGNFHEVRRDAVESGFGGGELHPGYEGESTASIAQIAAWHQHGTDRMPARPILNEPTPDLLARMVEPITDGYRKLTRACIP